jgi:Undecaprenyl-phosphate galactose phosphotransferase WbaP
MSRIFKLTEIYLLLADSAASLLALGLSALFASLTASPLLDIGGGEIFSLSIPFFLACISYFAAKGHYSLKASWWLQVEHILFASLSAFIVSALVIYAEQIPVQIAQNELLWLFMPPCLILLRWVARGILVKKGRWAIPTSLVGKYETIIKLIPALKAETYLVYDVQHALFLDAEETQIEDFKNLYPAVRIHSELGSLLLHGGYVLFCPGSRTSVHDEILAQLEMSNARFAYIPPAEGYFLYNVKPQRFFGFGMIALESKRPLLSGLTLILKDIMDRIGAAIALVLLSPVFIAISWLIKKDGGPALYGHRRIGQDGQLFTCLKFRSMVLNSKEILQDLLANNPDLRKEYEETYKLKNDPRVTKIGKLLRKTSLDELPQLLNVLCGHMSLTGPRPIVEDEKKYYAEKIHDYLSMKPGITGLWQVSGRSDTGYSQRVYLDSWYVRNWSLWNDVIILFKTVLTVLKRKGAY